MRPPAAIEGGSLRRLEDLWEGFTVYESANARGERRWIAPALNGFTVRRIANTGPSFELTHIVLGDPTVPVLPPADAQVTEGTEPQRMGSFPR